MFAAAKDENQIHLPGMLDRSQIHANHDILYVSMFSSIDSIAGKGRTAN